MIRVRTGSRLHFGFLSLPGADWGGQGAASTPLPARAYGGVGLMVEEPGVELTCCPAADWAASGPLADRVVAFCREYERRRPERASVRAHFTIRRAAPEHAGLGTGTQLGLAVAAALAAADGERDISAAELGRRVGRGLRSALGIHGFEHGGLLVEGGKARPGDVSPLLAALAFPRAWQLLVILPRVGSGLHGTQEAEAFRQLTTESLGERASATLCRLVLLGLLPALAERNFVAFGEALYEFNRRVGEAFRPAQAGVYAGPRSEAVVRFLRGLGVRGVGQSSWGPALFAVVARGEADDVKNRLRSTYGFEADEVLLTDACNHGAAVEQLPDRSELGA